MDGYDSIDDVPVYRRKSVMAALGAAVLLIGVWTMGGSGKTTTTSQTTLMQQPVKAVMPQQQQLPYSMQLPQFFMAMPANAHLQNTQMYAQQAAVQQQQQQQLLQQQQQAALAAQNAQLMDALKMINQQQTKAPATSSWVHWYTVVPVLMLLGYVAYTYVGGRRSDYGDMTEPLRPSYVGFSSV
eukprot:TRINITY_DN733_c3_g1_i1.p2 TRINITY_DN733_c3_g1~~TRINITY_DN733_c3_g1_i1.p2  ORF type:complete len:205 (+),score=106.46 TRINITY_DN733_c3_g1_i1:64-615(+)